MTAGFSSFLKPKWVRDDEVRFRGMTGSVGSGLTEFPLALRLSGSDTYTKGSRIEVFGLDRLFSCASSCANKPPRNGFVSVGTSDASSLGCTIQ